MNRMEKYYVELANAIITQAAEDYIYLLRTGKECVNRGRYCSFMVNKRELEKFFYSKYFAILTTIDPDYFIRLMKEAAQRKIKKQYRTNKI